MAEFMLGSMGWAGERVLRLVELFNETNEDDGSTEMFDLQYYGL